MAQSQRRRGGCYERVGGIFLLVVVLATVHHNYRQPFTSTTPRRHLQQTTPVTYHLWPSSEIHTTLQSWASDYPEFARVTTSQAAYGLSSAGGSSDCPFDDGDGCLNYILTIQDYTVHPEDSDSSNALPEVLWSGSLHGNERVGPTATMEAASLLLQAASCEAKPNMAVRLQATADSWAQELADATACRQSLEAKGITPTQRQWLARLVTTRRIVILPTANALGYYQNVREENGLDANRDFPFDVQDASSCMQTIAARSLNEVFREHLFQLALTFHAGTEVVAYEWGAPTYSGYSSPDDQAQVQIAAAYSLVGGAFSSTPQYDYGTMNDKVYAVRGGMEDWAYAGSWDPNRVIQCVPNTFGGYAAANTVYNDSTLRAFNVLVETSNVKEPTSTTLGSNLDVLDKDTSGNGHVSRNIRLSLLSADLVEPYLSIVAVDDLVLSDDVVPMASIESLAMCKRTKAVMVSGALNQIAVQWTVGGAIQIDETSLWYGKWTNLTSDQVDCISQPDGASSKLLQATSQNAVTGSGFFSPSGSSPAPQSDVVQGPLFQATLDLSSFTVGDEIVVLARARVDQSWMDQPTSSGTVGPAVLPQAHVVNARTNPDWFHESAGKVIQGRLDWYTTIPLTIVIGAGNGVAELSNRFESAGTCQAWGEMCLDASDCCSGICTSSLCVRRRQRLGNDEHVGGAASAATSSGFHTMRGLSYNQ